MIAQGKPLIGGWRPVAVDGNFPIAEPAEQCRAEVEIRRPDIVTGQLRVAEKVGVTGYDDALLFAVDGTGQSDDNR